MTRLQTSMFVALLPALLGGCPQEGSGGSSTGFDTANEDTGDGCIGPDCDPQPCQDSPDPWLPFPGGTSMGITTKPGCPGHTGSLAHSYDFNINYGTYETDNDLITTASSDGTVVEVVSDVVGSCYYKQSCDGYNGGWGNCVVIKLDDACGDVYERYCHLDEGPGAIFVTEGQHVCHGTPLGRIGNTGKSAGAHLHWQRENQAQQSVAINRFVEVDISDDCNACNQDSHLSPGCFDSENYQPDECMAPPADPCAGLDSGDYCGSNDDLGNYGGDPNDLVTCENGQIAEIVPCAYGCHENLPGQNDVCEEFPPDGPVCGNGVIEVGESCDGVNFGDTSCTDQGFDGGALNCTNNCQIDTTQCCADQCNIGATTCSNGAETQCQFDGACYEWGSPVGCQYGCAGNSCNNVSCGDNNINPGEQCDGNDLDGESCESMNFDGGNLQCSQNCSFDTSSCCTQDHTILNAEYPTYTNNNAGCAVNGGITLKLSAQQINDSTIRFRIKKTDDTSWGQAATLTLYVGDGPTCGFPVNVIKKTAPVIVNQTTQIIDLVVDPYDAFWGVNEVKQFWVGKSEGGYPAARSTGGISVKRECL